MLVWKKFTKERGPCTRLHEWIPCNRCRGSVGHFLFGRSSHKAGVRTKATISRPDPLTNMAATLSTLPEELRQEIISYLDYPDAWSLKQTSMLFLQVSSTLCGLLDTLVPFTLVQSQTPPTILCIILPTNLREHRY